MNEEQISANGRTDEAEVPELNLSISDLQNLVAVTEIAAIFLDAELRIKRFTPSAQKVFNLATSDIGRPLSEVRDRLADERLIADAQKVLEEFTPRERELRLEDEKWFLARLAPYRTEDDRVAGVVATSIDVTERKRAEIELRKLSNKLESELHRFDTIMGSVPDFVYQFDLQGRFTYANKALLDLWEKSSEEAMGKNFHELEYPPDLAATLQRQIQQVIETRLPLKDETPYTSAIGERQYEYIFFPLLDQDGRVESVAGVTRDITERKETQEALRTSEERFRAMITQSRSGIVQTDLTGKIIFTNDRFSEIAGYSREDLLQLRMRDITAEEDLPRNVELFQRLIEKGESFRIEKRYRRKDGSIVWVENNVTLIRDAEGKPQSALAVSLDIAARKEAEEALRASEERFRLLVEGTPDYAMFLLDLENTITYWSSGAEKVFGWSATEAIGQNGELIFTPEDRAKEQEEKELATAMRDGFAPDRRWHLRKDGKRIWVDGIMRRLDNPDGSVRGFAKIARDATDQKTIEEALRHARDEMEQRVIERTQDVLATNSELERTMKQRQQLEKELLEISEREKRRIGEDLHDMVCQELTATALFLKSSAKKVAPESEGASETLEEAAQIVNRNVGLTRDLARGLQPADLTGAGLKQALRSYGEQACENTGIKCHVKAARGVRVTDNNIALHLYRVAQEAVKNAVKHSAAKNVLVHLDHSKTHVCVSVQDDGKGFSPKLRSKGLGLHIMRYRANALGGELIIAKRKSGGMDITCKIPVTK